MNTLLAVKISFRSREQIKFSKSFCQNLPPGFVWVTASLKTAHPRRTNILSTPPGVMKKKGSYVSTPV
eukprot:Seg1852.6 transcript_id=Seg1852.6/GoldUCD/mRNA.D3Y31 product="hypothetical protein" pseudo=true protein_id=Seg1852.6/GoldUCD/D3Y31